MIHPWGATPARDTPLSIHLCPLFSLYVLYNTKSDSLYTSVPTVMMVMLVIEVMKSCPSWKSIMAVYSLPSLTDARLVKRDPSKIAIPCREGKTLLKKDIKLERK